MGHASMDQVASTHAGINDLIICSSMGMEDVVPHVTQEWLPGINRHLRVECGLSDDPAHNDDWAGVRTPWRDLCDGTNQGA